MERPELRDDLGDPPDLAEVFASLPGAEKTEIVLDVICDESGVIWSSPNSQN